MRTARIKLYRYSELSYELKCKVREAEAKRFNTNIGGVNRDYYNAHELIEAERRLIRTQAEFKSDGTRF